MLCLAAYAKINWTLDILGTRPDGYHLMDMLMQTVSLCDLLWMEEAEDLTLEAVPGGTVNAIVCVCDSINYLTELADITHVFRLANNYLESKGIFICDFKTRHYFKDVVADSTIAEDRDDVSFIWDNYYDTETDINELALSLFLPEYPESGIEPDDECPLYRKYQEFHYQRGLTLDDMRTCVADSGMELVAMYDAFTWLPATDSSERVYVVARETHQDNKHYE